MSTTNCAPPPVQGPVQQMAEVLGGKLAVSVGRDQGIGAESERAEGKVHAHHQERLKELCNTQETLEEELTGLGTEEIPGALTPSIQSLQDLLGLEATAVPADPKTLNASQPRVSSSPCSQERP